jgi:FkbM family methyltransferase
MLRKLAVEAMALYLRRTPWERGRWRLVRLAWPWSHKLAWNSPKRVVITRRGFRLVVDLQEWIDRHIYITGEYETAESRVIQALIQPGDTVLDIGANIGYFTLLTARRIFPGKVYAFEPMPLTRQKLLDNLVLNQTDNAIVRSEALCDRPGELELHFGPPKNQGMTSLRPVQRSAGSVKVPTARLDDLLPVGERVTLAKIDVEGAEYAVLQGMQTCLERDQPDLIVEVTESYLGSLGESSAMLRQFLYGRGYRMYVIDNDALVPLKPDDPNPAEQYNALFTRRDKLPEALSVLLPGRNSGNGVTH